MHVLLVNPPSPYLTDPLFAPPLGLLYLGAALEWAGHDVTVLDLNLPGAQYPGNSFNIVGVTVVTANYPYALQTVQKCKQLYPRAAAVVGGPHLSVKPDDWEDLGAHYFVRGDGETAITNLANSLQSYSTPFSPEVSVPLADLNATPRPARHLVPINKYTCQLDGRKATTLVTQRGCPFNCAFCSRWEQTRVVRTRRIDNVMEEVDYLKRLGFSSLVFHDDEMNLNNKRVLHLCNELAKHHVRFKANARADLFTDLQAEAFAMAGCSWLCFGVESGSHQILKAASKGTTPEVNARARAICRKFGIKFKAFAIVGLPGETPETVEQTKRWLIENEVDDLTVTMFVPFPGSAVYEHPENFPDIKFRVPYQQAPLPFRGTAGLELSATVQTPTLSAEALVQLPEQLENEVRAVLGLRQGAKTAS